MILPILLSLNLMDPDIPYGFAVCAKLSDGLVVTYAQVQDEPIAERTAHEAIGIVWQDLNPPPSIWYRLLKVDEAWVEQLTSEHPPCQG